MSFRSICKILGFYLSLFTATLMIPLSLALYYQTQPRIFHPQPHTTASFLNTIAISLALASFFILIGRKAKGNISYREGIVAVVAIWFFSAALGGLPFYFSQTLKNPVDAYFEAMSGLTTTGASVMCPKKYDRTTEQEELIENTISIFYNIRYAYKGTIEPVMDPHTGAVLKEGVEAVSKVLLFWRAFMQWLGGSGIVVLFVAFLPALGMGGKMLFQVEVSGPSKEGMTPRIKETAAIIWRIYCGISLLQMALLLVTNPHLSLYDATLLTLSTVSTGGYSHLNSSIAGYNSLSIELIVIFFMLLGSINFGLLYHILRGKFFRLFNVELLLFLLFLLFFGALVSWSLVGTSIELLNGDYISQLTPWQAMRYGFFQVISAQTSTGYSLANYDLWPPESQLILLMVMYLGGMAGSTTGGMKILRAFMLFKIFIHSIEILFRPNSIRILRINDREVASHSLILVLCYFFGCIALTVLGTLLFTWDGIDPETAVSVATCMINNTGIAFRMAGPTSSFAFLSSFSKIISIFLMVLGRLEIFFVLVLFTPSFWRK